MLDVNKESKRKENLSQVSSLNCIFSKKHVFLLCSTDIRKKKTDRERFKPRRKKKMTFYKRFKRTIFSKSIVRKKKKVHFKLKEADDIPSSIHFYTRADACICSNSDGKEESEKLTELHSFYNKTVLPLKIQTKIVTNYDGYHLSKMKNTWELRSLALSSSGLVSSDIRKSAWPILLSELNNRTNNRNTAYNIDNDENEKDHVDIMSVFTKAEIDLIQQDIKRSLWHPKRFENTDDEIFEKSLFSVITHSLIQYYQEDREASTSTSIRKLDYYQGYHDLSSLVLLACDNDEVTATNILSALSSTHLIDYVQNTTKSFQSTLQMIAIASRVLLDVAEQYSQQGEEEGDLYEYLFHSQQTNLHPQPEGHLLHHFILSWVISWFAHDIKDFHIACRIMDVCISSHPCMSLYLSVALLILPKHKQAIMNTRTRNRKRLDTDDENGVLQVIQKLPDMLVREALSKIGDKDQIVEEWIDRALWLMKKVPPDTILSKAVELYHSCSTSDDDDEEDSEYTVTSQIEDSTFKNIFSQNFSSSSNNSLTTISSLFEEKTTLKPFDVDSSPNQICALFDGMETKKLLKFERALTASGKYREYRLLLKNHKKKKKEKVFLVSFFLSGGLAIILLHLLSRIHIVVRVLGLIS